MNSKDIPEHAINQAVAEAEGLEITAWGWGRVLVSRYDRIGIMHPVSVSPYTDDTQYHLIMDPETTAKVRDVMAKWFFHAPASISVFNDPMQWWHHPDFMANERLWMLRGLVEVKRHGR